LDASDKGFATIVQLLLEAGADKEAKEEVTERGYPAYMLGGYLFLFSNFEPFLRDV
jgi:hypothetical protein